MHVILFVIDTLRADHLSCYGYPRRTSPNLDTLTKAGIVFEQHITPAAHTNPAFASIITGQEPFHHGIVANLHAVTNERTMVLDDLTMTLAEVLASAGYVTIAFDNLASFISHPTWYSRGFRYYVKLTPHPGMSAHLTSDEVNEELLPWIERMDFSKPNFPFIHYWDPHKPYNQPERFRGIF